MKKKILSLLLVACLMLVFSASAYAAQTTPISKEFSLNEVFLTDYIDLPASYIGSNKNVGFHVVLDQPDVSYTIGVFDYETGKNVALKSFKSSVYVQRFENVLEEGKKYKFYILNFYGVSNLSGKLTVLTY